MFNFSAELYKLISLCNFSFYIRKKEEREMYKILCCCSLRKTMRNAGIFSVPVRFLIDTKVVWVFLLRNLVTVTLCNICLDIYCYFVKREIVKKIKQRRKFLFLWDCFNHWIYSQSICMYVNIKISLTCFCLSMHFLKSKMKTYVLL